ncbi:unnamed protein product, partial [Amoebophrya sp. A25]
KIFESTRCPFDVSSTTIFSLLKENSVLDFVLLHRHKTNSLLHQHDPQPRNEQSKEPDQHHDESAHGRPGSTSRYRRTHHVFP